MAAVPTQTLSAVRDVSFSLAPGEVLGLVGESGSGKSITSLAIMRLLPPQARVSGEILFSGNGAAQNLATLPDDSMRHLRGSRIAMIFQEPMTALNPVMRIGAQIEEAIRVHGTRCSSADARSRAVESLKTAAVPEPSLRARQYPHQLSGGLRQRALIAMALVAGPRVLIADEPTTALDATVQKQILELLAHLQCELGLAMIFITHDLGVVAQVASRVAVMYAGRIIEEGPTHEILHEPGHPYTAGLLRAAPRLKRGTLTPIPGTVPSLDALPPGCAFAPRCEFHRAECDIAVPELAAASPDHHARCILVSEGVAR